MEASQVTRGATGPDEQARLAALARAGWQDLPRGFAEDAVRLVADLCAAPAAAVVLIDAEQQLALALQGALSRILPRSMSPLLDLLTLTGASPCWTVADARLEPRWAEHPVMGGEAGFRAGLAVPLVCAEGWVLGGLAVFDTQPRAFSTAQCEAVQAAARLLVGAWDGARATRLLERLDPAGLPGEGLGGLPAEAALLQRLQQEWQRHARRGESLGLVCLAAPAGLDDRAVTEAVSASLRSSDFLARLDDRRMAALLPATGVNATMHVAQRIRQALERAHGAEAARVAHIGLAALVPKRTGAPADVLQRARHALQRAEQSALGRIETFSGW